MDWTYNSGSYDGRYLQLYIWEDVDASSNSSTLNWRLSSIGGNDNFYRIDATNVSINGEVVYSKGVTNWYDKVFPAAKGSVSGSVKVVHNADGTKTGVAVRFSTRVFTHGALEFANASINLTQITTYTLSLSAGTGSNITVNRTSSGYAGTGNLSHGSRLYYNDKLKITFTPNSNYGIVKHTVNGSDFTSGNTHTVTANVSIIATAIQLKSDVGATDANIGSTSTITITRYNSSYTHTLTFNFGGLTGTIVEKTPNTSVPWTLPTSFYEKIPNSKVGTCTIYCETFNGNTSLGTSSCTLIATASPELCAPTVSGTVVDTNATTLALTGGNDENTILIRYKSTAKCTISATVKNSAEVSTKTVNGYATTDDVKTFTSVSNDSFTFRVEDTRGYQASKVVSPTVISYIQLTCNPIIKRPVATSNSMMLSLDGSMYRGSFGVYTNTLTIDFRYAEYGGSYSEWESIDTTNIVFGTSTYRSNGEILLGDTFDYRKNYDFQIRVRDGAGDYILSSVTKNVFVSRGIPIYDWGENDFNFNVPIMLHNVNILNIMYPVGAVYMHSSDTIPTAISEIGTWVSVTSGIDGVYAWKRTE